MSVYRTFRRWETKGIFDVLWALLLLECEELAGMDWQWQAADGCLGKARGVPKKSARDECVGRNPTDRAKAGVKKSLLVEADGGPLAICLEFFCIAGANVPDISLLASTLDAIVVQRPIPSVQEPQHLCLDRGYENRTGYALCERLGYTPHVRRVGHEKQDANGAKTLPARRWVVERTFSRLSHCRAILVRWDKKAECHLAQVKPACALFWFRRLHDSKAAQKFCCRMLATGLCDTPKSRATSRCDILSSL